MDVFFVCFLLACLLTYLLTSLPFCWHNFQMQLYTYLLTSLPPYSRGCFVLLLLGYWLACLLPYLLNFLLICKRTFRCTYIRTYLITNLLTSVLTWLFSYFVSCWLACLLHTYSSPYLFVVNVLSNALYTYRGYLVVFFFCFLLTNLLTSFLT